MISFLRLTKKKAPVMNHQLAMCFCSMSVGTMTPTSPSSLTRSLPPSGRALAGGWGGGVADFKWGDDRRSFLGVEIFDSTVFIWEGKFGKYFYW